MCRETAGNDECLRNAASQILTASTQMDSQRKNEQGFVTGWKQQKAAVVCELHYLHSLAARIKCIIAYHFIFQRHTAIISDGTTTSRTRRYSMSAVKEKYFKIILFTTSHLFNIASESATETQRSPCTIWASNSAVKLPVIVRYFGSKFWDIAVCFWISITKTEILLGSFVLPSH